MIHSKVFKIFSLSFILTLALAVGVSAQQLPQQQQQVTEDFSDEEIEKFVKINQEIMPIQEQMQGRMMETIEETGLDVNRFNELAQAMQQGNIKEASEDPQEIAKFNEAGQKVMEMNQEMGAEYQKRMTAHQMDPERFQQIMMAYQQSENVRNKVDRLMDDEN
ncbi:DUF4168 domain-containing protein [Anditalea andensis]|uniref:DUF4168 domain-containing protein n=1 Tax=Anditalea andensis TaxID=1048983 RepID=A0A074KY07_9BACT|nr:DUF4168 domain-containing protein [Anditalea andensis]KEO74861.1 hypothetical protein EL17_04060 [Anditalea andensis]